MPSVIGYEIHYLHDDLSVGELFYRTRVISTKWESVVALAKDMAETRRIGYLGSTIISAIGSDSKTKCDTRGRTVVYRHIRASDSYHLGEIVIFAVYAGDL